MRAAVVIVVAAGLSHVAEELGVLKSHSVMAGLVPAIHVLSRGTKNVDARDKPGHDDLL